MALTKSRGNMHDSENNPIINCSCGCGSSFPKYDDRGRPRRYTVGHSRKGKCRPFEQRFWEKVDKSNPDGCWEWKAYRDDKGYGAFSIGSGLTKRTKKAHVVSWELTFGKIPEAWGINVFETMAGVGITIDRHPEIVRKVMLVGKSLEGKDVGV